jgi:hypothetical protein
MRLIKVNASDHMRRRPGEERALEIARGWTDLQRQSRPAPRRPRQRVGAQVRPVGVTPAFLSVLVVAIGVVHM